MSRDPSRLYPPDEIEMGSVNSERTTSTVGTSTAAHPNSQQHLLVPHSSTAIQITQSSTAAEGAQVTTIPRASKNTERSFIIFLFLLKTGVELVPAILLIGYIFKYKLEESQYPASLPENLRPGFPEVGQAYLVDLEQSILAFIIFFPSTVVRTSGVFTMSFYAYRVASQMIILNNIPARQFTPWQVGLAIGILSGSAWGSIWDSIKYFCTCGWRKNQKKVWKIEVPFSGTSQRRDFDPILTSIFWLFLGVNILAIGVVVTAGLFTRMLSTIPYEIASLNYGSHPGFSRNLSSECISRYSNVTFQEADPTRSRDPAMIISRPCSLEYNYTYTPIAGGGRIITHAGSWVANPRVVFETLNNVSTLHKIFTHTSNISGSDRTYAILGPGNIPDNMDFEANTYALSTDCRLITKDCNIREIEEAVRYNCKSRSIFNTESDANSAIYGDLAVRPWNISFQKTDKRDESARINAQINPIFLSIAGQLLNSDLVDVPDNIVRTTYGLVFVAVCTSKLEDIAYSYRNGFVSAISRSTPGSGQVAAILSGPMALRIGESNLIQRAELALLRGSSDAFENELAQAISHVALSIGSGSFAAYNSILEVRRIPKLATRVPYIILWSFVILSILSWLLGFGFFCWALERIRVNGVCDVQSRMTVRGLTVMAFEHDNYSSPCEDQNHLTTEYEDNTINSHTRISNTNNNQWWLVHDKSNHAHE